MSGTFVRGKSSLDAQAGEWINKLPAGGDKDENAFKFYNIYHTHKINNREADSFPKKSH